MECLQNDVDASGILTRDVFEELAKPVLDRLLAPVKKVGAHGWAAAAGALGRGLECTGWGGLGLGAGLLLGAGASGGMHERPGGVACCSGCRGPSPHARRRPLAQPSRAPHRHHRHALASPPHQALADAGLEPGQVANVEVVGGTSRVPAVLRQLTEFFGREPSRTLNAKETVSRGCALQCAMLSPTFRVRDFQVQDSFPYGVQFRWVRCGARARAGGNAGQGGVLAAGLGRLAGVPDGVAAALPAPLQAGLRRRSPARRAPG